MSDEVTDYLVSELGFGRRPAARPGLQRAVAAFLGPHLEQRTIIQEMAIEAVYDGADVLLISATASGKTEAVTIPISARLMTEQEKPLAVYVAPTRALLNDLHRRLEAPLGQLGLELGIRHADRALSAETNRLRVLLTTPESLDVLLSKNTSLLKRTRYAILDEIHQVFGTPRGDQLAFLLQRLEGFADHRIQRLALSATVGDPSQVAAWLCPGHQPARVIVAPGARQIVADFHWLSKVPMLRALIAKGEYDKVLCFVNSRRRCDDVHLALRDLQPYESYVHYSTLTREQREYVEQGFKSAQMAVCVATTTLELGIDVGSIQKIVLVDAPSTVDSFLQRIGRGGRRGPYTYVTATPQSTLELLQFATMVHLGESGRVECRTAGHAYSAAIQQVFSILAGKRRLNLHPDELAEQFACFSWLRVEHLNPILDGLVHQEYLRRRPGSPIYELGSALEDLIDHGQIFTNISGESTGTPVYHGGRLLAHLPLRANQLRHGNVILFAGRFWRILGISDRGLTVDLAAPVAHPVRPAWGTKGGFAMSSLLAHGMREVLANQPTLANHLLDDECACRLQALYRRSTGLEQVTDAVWRETAKGRHVYYTFAGAIENQILRLIFREHGQRCEPAERAEGVALQSRDPLDFDCIPSDPERVMTLIAAQWRHFGAWVSKGRYFELLPSALKRDEAMAQIAIPSVIRKVTDLSGARASPVELGLL